MLWTDKDTRQAKTTTTTYSCASVVVLKGEISIQQATQQFGTEITQLAGPFKGSTKGLVVYILSVLNQNTINMSDNSLLF